MSKKYLKRPKREKYCLACKEEGEKKNPYGFFQTWPELMLITLPRDKYLRPRTEAEAENVKKLFDGYLKGEIHPNQIDDESHEDKLNRTIRLCPNHIKSYCEAQGTTKVNRFDPKKRA